jgi:Histidine phosphatase superfamily (branch 1)
MLSGSSCVKPAKLRCTLQYTALDSGRPHTAGVSFDSYTHKKGTLLKSPQVIYLARHGETAWSLSGQHTGRTDLPLTKQGECNARRLGERLKGLDFARVFTSPLQRADLPIPRAVCGLIPKRFSSILTPAAWLFRQPIPAMPRVSQATTPLQR